MRDIPKFRYLDEALRFVRYIDKELTDSEQLIKDQQRQLAFLIKPMNWVGASLAEKRVTAALEIFNITQGPVKRNKRLNQTIDPKLTKVVVPNLSKLKSQYTLIEDLYERHKALESIETQIRMQFESARDLKNALAEIAAVKAKVEAQMKSVFTYLNEVAQAHVPEAFTTYVKAINNEIEEHVAFVKSSVFLYVNTSKGGAIVFTSYTMLEEAVNDDGEVAPHLYIAVQWSLGAPKADEPQYVRVFLDHDYELPGKLAESTSGIDVNSAQDAVRAISNLLDVENFSSSLGTIPLSLQLKIDPNALSSQIFSYREHLQKVGVEDNMLVFVFKPDPSATRESMNPVAQQLFLEVRQLLKKSKGTKIRTVIGKKGKSWSVAFKIEGQVGARDFSMYDAEFMKEKFGLSDQQLRKVVQILNQGETK